MQTQSFTVRGAGKFRNIVLIRRRGDVVTEVHADTSENRDVARSQKQAKQWLAERVEQLRLAGCEVLPA